MKGKYIKKEKKINTKSLQPQTGKREQIHRNGAFSQYISQSGC